MKIFDEELHFKLFPNVVPIKGYNRSLIMDLLKGKSYFVPNSYIDMFNDHDFDLTPLNRILAKINDKQEREAIIEYVHFSLENNLALLGSSQIIEGLTLLDNDFFPSSKINNSILEISISSRWSVEKVLFDLNELGTKHLEIRFLDFTSYENEIETIIKNIKDSSIESVILYIPSDRNLKNSINQHITKQVRISKIVVYNSETGFSINESTINIIFSSQKTINHEDCGEISSSYFTVNTGDYVNNINVNNCLAYKISVDVDGKIKNCPSSRKSFGNILNNTLNEVIAMNDFKLSWKITKNDISVCSICEFRMMCSDCRVFIDDSSDIYSRPSKCSYNPYINLWKDEEDYVSIQECGVKVTINGVTINKKKLQKINDRIWA